VPSRAASHATPSHTSPTFSAASLPLGQRKRCPLCERLRQAGGLLRLGGEKASASSGSTESASSGASRAGADPQTAMRRQPGLGRLIALLLLAAIALQGYFAARVALATVVDPESTAFQRSELWRLAISTPSDGAAHPWRQQWVPYDAISDHLKRAVMASEDARFTEHTGVEWEAIESAWARNSKAMEAAEKRAEAEDQPVGNVKIRGGSTITQQLAKNLFLSSERNYARKGQELVLTKELEAALSKRRILEVYLNNVEWGQGVFGAEAAAQRYFRKPASALTRAEAARLAVMLPRPKFFEQRPGSVYLNRQSGRIAARMQHVSPP
jgi:monofunctional biosynthetic peptidoglycan transglycosylase